MTHHVHPWTCQKCNAENDPDFTHCRLCGEKRPEHAPGEQKCAHCGEVCTGYFACPKCGSEEFLQL